MQQNIISNSLDLLDKEKFNNERKSEETINNNISKYLSKINDKENQNKLIKCQFMSLTDRERSSDSTSISLSQIESLSQSSESSKFIPFTYNSQEINSNDINKKDLLQEEIIINYFKETENYFCKIMPESFSEYKKSKNYFLKSEFKEKEKIEQKTIENKTENEEYKIEENKFNNSHNLTLNNLYYPVYLFQYNSYYNNYPSFNKEKKVDNCIKPKKEIIKSKDGGGRFLEKYRENSNDEIEDEENVYIIVKQKNFKNHPKNKEKIQKNTNEISKECNFHKKNYNCKYFNNYNQNYTYKNRNHNYSYNYNSSMNYNKECSFTDGNHNEQINNFYKKNNNYCKRARKIIYY